MGKCRGQLNRPGYQRGHCVQEQPTDVFLCHIKAPQEASAVPGSQGAPVVPSVPLGARLHTELIKRGGVSGQVMMPAKGRAEPDGSLTHFPSGEVTWEETTSLSKDLCMSKPSPGR